MENSTPFANEAEYRSWWEANAPTSYGYCWCGCGKKTKVANETRLGGGRWDIKGCPRKYLRFHEKRVDLDDPANYERANTGYETPCLLWKRAIGPNGYGYIRLAGQVESVHRVLYQKKFGALAPEDHLHHLCEVKHCVNVNHLEQTTNGVHVSRHSRTANNKRHDATSRYKGVRWRRDRRVWSAKITVDGRDIALGTFSEEKTAAHAYDTAAFKAWGENCFLNFPSIQDVSSKPRLRIDS